MRSAGNAVQTEYGKQTATAEQEQETETGKANNKDNMAASWRLDRRGMIRHLASYRDP